MTALKQLNYIAQLKGVISENEITLKELASSPTHISGFGKIYSKSDGNLYFKNSSGTETNLLSGSSGANTTLSNLTSPTAINQDLLASGTRNIGNNSTGIWENIYSKNLIVYNSSATPLSLERTSVSPALWNFNISHDPLGTGSFLSSGSLSIVSQTVGTNFSIRVGNSGTSQFRIFPTYTEIVGNDSTNGYQLKINNLNANSANYISFVSHSNSYQGTEYYFGGTEYAWLNVTGNSHSTPAFMQIANDINATNSRIGIRVAGQQKAIFKQRSIILNPSSFTDSSTSPFMLRDDSNVSGEAFRIEGDSSKDTSFWINQSASNKYFSLGGQVGLYSMWMAYAGTTHPTQPSRAFLSFDDPNGILGIRANNDNKFTVTYAGNIGIGNNFYNPTSLLHLKGTNPELKIEASSNSAYLKVVSSGTNQEAGLYLMNSAGEYGNMFFYGTTHSNISLQNRMILSKSTGSIGIYVGSSNKLNVTATGVGIGADHLTPSYPLHVKHSSSNDVAMFENVSTDAYVNIKSTANKGSYVIFQAGSSTADFGLTGSSHPTIPNVFAFTINPESKTRYYISNTLNFSYQYHLDLGNPRFSLGLNYESDSIVGIKRSSGDTADSLSIKDENGNTLLRNKDNFLGLKEFLYLGENIDTHLTNSNAHFELQFNTVSGYDPLYLIDENGSNVFSILNNGMTIISNSIIPNFFRGIDIELGSLASGERFSNLYTQAININPTSDKPSIKLFSGLCTTPENGGIEYDSTNGFYITHAGTRNLIATSSNSSINKYRGIYSLFYVDIDNTTDILTIDSSLSTASKLTYDLLDTGDGILFDTSTLPTGINNTTIYYIRRISSTTFSLHPTKTDAINNTNIVNITGSTNLTDRPITVREFNLKGDTTLNGRTGTGSIITCNIPAISTLSDLDKFEIDYSTGENSTTIELNLNSTDFGAGTKFVYKSGSSFIISTSQTISIGNTSNAYTRIVIQYKATENYFIVSELNYS